MLISLREFAKKLGVSSPTALKIAIQEDLLVCIGNRRKVSVLKFETWAKEKGLM